ncbi:MAG TPA: hypothetical protein VIX73_34465, partial [Kofleriaceae bacterium]
MSADGMLPASSSSLAETSRARKPTLTGQVAACISQSRKLPGAQRNRRFVHSMSYLHCPTCSRAFNLAQHPSCPSCPVRAVPVDPVADLVAAVDALARALAYATPAQRAA